MAVSSVARVIVIRAVPRVRTYRRGSPRERTKPKSVCQVSQQASQRPAQAIGATTNVLARGGGVRWHTVDVEAISGETLDAQTLNRAEAANVADASAGVVDVARSS
jgi:hypothetical protein